MKINYIFKFSQLLFILYQYLSGKEITGTFKAEKYLVLLGMSLFCAQHDTAIKSG